MNLSFGGNMRSIILCFVCFIFLAVLSGCSTTQSKTTVQTSAPANKVTLKERFDMWDDWVREHMW